MAITVFNPTVTAAGRAAAIASDGEGLSLAITHISLGTGKYSLVGAESRTAMAALIETVTISGGSSAASSFRVTARFPARSTGSYTASEAGFWAGNPASGGVLFAVWSDPTETIAVRSNIDYIAAFGLALSGVPGAITVSIDTGAAGAVGLISAHESAANPHPQYFRNSANVSTNSANFNSITGIGSRAVVGNGTWAGSTNGPVSAYGFGMLEVMTDGANVVTQRYVTHTGSDTWMRSKFNASDWEAWRLIITSTNIGSYAPSLTGTGANGTWGINISGTAATATSAATAAQDTNGTQIATTAFVLGQASSATPLVNAAAAVGTSLRYARGDHVHPTDSTRAPLASPALTGTPTAPTAAVGTNNTQVATTAFVIGQASNLTPLANSVGSAGSSATMSRGDHVHPVDTTRAAISAFGNSLTANGYQRLQGGLIMQWMTGSTVTVEGVIPAMSFPISFPTSVLAVIASTNTAGLTDPGFSDGFFQVVSKTNSDVTLVAQNPGGAASFSNGLIPTVFAIGY